MKIKLKYSIKWDEGYITVLTDNDNHLSTQPVYIGAWEDQLDFYFNNKDLIIIPYVTDEPEKYTDTYIITDRPDSLPFESDKERYTELKTLRTPIPVSIDEYGSGYAGNDCK